MSGNCVNRKLDIVFCIDGTGSMSGCIESVKDNAKLLYKKIKEQMESVYNVIDALRIKIIVFRDYKSDGDLAMQESDFFELPTDESYFDEYLREIRARGGCGEDANGLEALYFAMKSDFVATGPKDRQIIVLFADTPPIKMKEREGYGIYPKNMVDEEGLLYTWSNFQGYKSKLTEKGKRLIVYAPNQTYYNTLCNVLDHSFFVPVEMSMGLDDVSMDDVIKMIVSSVK